VPWVQKPAYWLLFTVPTLPLLVFIIPRGFTFLSRPSDPWYTPYTSQVFLLVVFYVKPATALSSVIGVRPMSGGWVAFVLLYTCLIGWGLCALVSRLRAAA